MELGGLEPPTPCLQSDVFTRVSGLDLHNRLSLSDRHVRLATGVNGTLMARDLGLDGCKDAGRDWTVRVVPEPGGAGTGLPGAAFQLADGADWPGVKRYQSTIQIVPTKLKHC